jgi:hypothetical protein
LRRQAIPAQFGRAFLMQPDRSLTLPKGAKNRPLWHKRLKIRHLPTLSLLFGGCFGHKSLQRSEQTVTF